MNGPRAGVRIASHVGRGIYTQEAVFHKAAAAEEQFCHKHS
jgi:hypothetical protein